MKVERSGRDPAAGGSAAATGPSAAATGASAAAAPLAPEDPLQPAVARTSAQPAAAASSAARTLEEA